MTLPIEDWEFQLMLAWREEILEHVWRSELGHFRTENFFSMSREIRDSATDSVLEAFNDLFST